MKLFQHFSCFKPNPVVVVQDELKPFVSFVDGSVCVCEIVKNVAVIKTYVV